MKRFIQILGAAFIINASLFFTAGPKIAVADSMEYRVFFLHTTTSDGTTIRRTGCINIGGSCWSEATEVADCSVDGGVTWTGCEDNRTSLAPGTN